VLHTDQRFSDAVAAAVATIEASTDAEIVVVAAPRSGSYRDLALTAAGVITLAALGGFLFMPWEVAPLGVLVETALVAVVSAWLLDGNVPIRLLARAARMEEQVQLAAAAEFHREAVHATPNRTGLLVYVSALEQQVVLIPDVGLDARIPRGAFAGARRDLHHADLDHFLSGLTKVGALLAAHVPKRADDAIDLPNAPRIRS
jgi:putative membrane protein